MMRLPGDGHHTHCDDFELNYRLSDFNPEHANGTILRGQASRIQRVHTAMNRGRVTKLFLTLRRLSVVEQERCRETGGWPAS